MSQQQRRRCPVCVTESRCEEVWTLQRTGRQQTTQAAAAVNGGWRLYVRLKLLLVCLKSYISDPIDYDRHKSLMHCVSLTAGSTAITAQALSHSQSWRSVFFPSLDDQLIDLSQRTSATAAISRVSPLTTTTTPTLEESLVCPCSLCCGVLGNPLPLFDHSLTARLHPPFTPNFPFVQPFVLVCLASLAASSPCRLVPMLPPLPHSQLALPPPPPVPPIRVQWVASCHCCTPTR